MGKVGRFACIFTPMALSIASLVCLFIIWLAGITGGLSNYYFMRADLTNFNADPNFDPIPGSNIDDAVLQAFRGSATANNTDNIYQIYIWNYCSGDSPSDLSCSSRRASFWFNPIEVWGLENTTIQERFPQKLQDGLAVYRRVAGWMFAAYAIAFWVTVAEIVLGLFAICSRWGSLVTSIASGVSTLFAIAAAATSTALYSTLVGTFESVLKPYNVEATIGRRMLATTWLAAAFSLAAGLFWLVSSCCCSGKSSDGKRGRKGLTAEKAPYTYERVSSPYLAGAARGHGRESDTVPLRSMGAQYEPYRNTAHV